jgi:hypothetical protein
MKPPGGCCTFLEAIICNSPPKVTLLNLIIKERRQARMGSPSVLDKTYHIIIQRMIKTGQAPHYTEIAAELGVPVEDGRKSLHDLISAGIPGTWLFPDTDYIGSFAPFSNLPTQYRITVGGKQKWFGQ